MNLFECQQGWQNVILYPESFVFFDAEHPLQRGRSEHLLT